MKPQKAWMGSNVPTGEMSPTQDWRKARPGQAHTSTPAVGREPADPFLVHAREVLRVAEDERGVDDLLHRAARGLEDGLDVPEALARLLLDRRPDDGTGGRMERAP